MSSTLLVIDDEELMRKMLGELLTAEGYEVSSAADGQEALESLEVMGAAFFDFILCDLRMPRMDGLEFLRRANGLGCPSTIIVMSAYGTLDTAIQALKSGAYDYLSKPFKTDEVLLTLKKAEERERLIRENQELKRTLQNDYRFESIVTKSTKMKTIFDLLRKVADYRSAVLFEGENGAGKERLARALHYNSKRRGGPFITLNCSAVPEHLLESELFGQERGAFTEATRTMRGAMEDAGGGTLFLEEIGALPLFMQVRLLRALQDNSFHRVGGNRDIPVEARLAASTAGKLQDLVGEGKFREDLFYRLNVIPIKVPPLRERRDDIPPLVDAFLAKYSDETQKEIRGVTPEAMEAILRYSWKGNVRELENVMERAVVLADGPLIELNHLMPWLQEEGFSGVFGVVPDDLSIKKAVARVEEELIHRALRKTRGNRTEASRMLEISHRTLLYKIKDYHVDL